MITFGPVSIERVTLERSSATAYLRGARPGMHGYCITTRGKIGVMPVAISSVSLVAVLVVRVLNDDPISRVRVWSNDAFVKFSLVFLESRRSFGAMNLLRKKLAVSPIYPRVLPYILIVTATFFQDSFGETARYWIYFAKMILGAWCIWEMRAFVPEMRWAVSWEAVLVGVLICGIWVGLDPFYPKFELLFKAGNPWNPFKCFGEGSAAGWFFFWMRTLGSAIIVPPLEEVFFRSFLYRYVVSEKFDAVAMNRFHLKAFVITALLFGFSHFQWLAGVLCGMAYQWLVIRKNRLGDAMFAHAVTNFLLGLWILWRGDWHFW